jgi:hypothetical protein
MRTPIALTVTVLSLAWAAPAGAQMCGGQTTGSTASTGMMCGMMNNAATSAPTTAPSTSPPAQSAAGGCPCCRNMAMMQGGMSGHATPPATQSRPAQPSMPDMPGMTPRQ